MGKELIEKISNYIIEEVKNNSDSSMSGFQYCVSYGDISEMFELEIHEYITSAILAELDKRKEVADAIYDTDGFDVVLFTDYAPNYTNEECE